MAVCMEKAPPNYGTSLDQPCSCYWGSYCMHNNLCGWTHMWSPEWSLLIHTNTAWVPFTYRTAHHSRRAALGPLSAWLTQPKHKNNKWNTHGTLLFKAHICQPIFQAISLPLLVLCIHDSYWERSHGTWRRGDQEKEDFCFHLQYQPCWNPIIHTLF